MQKFSESAVKNQSFYTCRRCFAHIYLHSNIKSVNTILTAHELDRENTINTKRNQYALECDCGAYLGFFRPDLQTIVVCYSLENPIQSNNVSTTN